MTRIIIPDVSAAWHEGNDAGEGFAACECPDSDCGCSLTSLDVGEFLGVTPEGMALYRDGDEYVIVGNAHGPWAVRVKGT